uniref:Extensin-like n=1 Tax=Cicer arietinum TaxID=3827 RepID=A0A1S2XNZ3_CICAR|nr:putative uncharacterized protein DDB_G0290521 [Cicer arietinum]
MARTKTFARKNAYPYSPSSSSPSSTSISRSPSPPPRPAPPATSSYTTFSYYLSSSPKTNPNTINPNPMTNVLPPLYTCPPPNLAQVPSHLQNPTTAKRHFMRVPAGIGTSKASNTKPSLFIISNSKTDEPSETPSHTTQIEKEITPTKPITLSKSSFSSKPSQSTPLNQNGD